LPAAYSSWNISIYYTQDPLVNTLSTIGMILFVLFVVLFSMDKLRTTRRLVASLIAINHVAYVITYSKAYNTTIKLLPLLDLITDAKGRSSLLLDFTQLMLLYLTLSYITEQRRKRQDKTKPL